MDDAVNHQIPRQPVVGRAAIEEFHRQTFAGGPLTCTPINLVVEGDWAALEWTDPDGFRGCGLSGPRRSDRAPARLLGQRTAARGPSGRARRLAIWAKCGGDPGPRSDE